MSEAYAWELLSEAAGRAAHAGRASDACGLWLEALRIVELNSPAMAQPDAQRALVHHNAALAHWMQGRVEAAEANFYRALGLRMVAARQRQPGQRMPLPTSSSRHAQLTSDYARPIARYLDRQLGAMARAAYSLTAVAYRALIAQHHTGGSPCLLPHGDFLARVLGPNCPEIRLLRALARHQLESFDCEGQDYLVGRWRAQYFREDESVRPFISATFLTAGIHPIIMQQLCGVQLRGCAT